MPSTSLSIRIQVTCLVGPEPAMWKDTGVKHTNVSIPWLLESSEIGDTIQPTVATMYNYYHLLTIKMYIKFLFSHLCNIEAMLSFDK